MYNQEQLKMIEEFKMTRVAFASKAFRNNGEVSPITVMFEGYNVDDNNNAPVLAGDIEEIHARFMQKFGPQSNILRRLTMLTNMTEERFDNIFADYGVTSDMVDFGYYNEEGQFVGTPLVISLGDIFEEEASLIRVDTTDEAVALTSEGETKNNWQVKKVGDIVLTKDGKTIYHRVQVAPLGTPNKRIRQDQSFKQDIAKVTENKATKTVHEDIF